MKLTELTGLTVLVVLAGTPVALAGVALTGSANGSVALALAGVVAPYSPTLSPAEKKAVAALFAGKTDGPYTTRILVMADKIVCRTSNVDIAARSCELTFGNTIRKSQGREANELYATIAMAGIPSDGGTYLEAELRARSRTDQRESRRRRAMLLRNREVRRPNSSVFRARTGTVPARTSRTALDHSICCRMSSRRRKRGLIGGVIRLQDRSIMTAAKSPNPRSMVGPA
jgi:hypothetical protein